MPVLGAFLDADLTLQPLVDHAVGRLISDSCALLATLRDLGLGIPHQLAAFPLRADANALFKIELCASASARWLAVDHKVNTGQYCISKQVLEAEAVSFGMCVVGPTVP